jgi:hypothetical protein
MKPGNELDSPHIALSDVEKGVNKARSKIVTVKVSNGLKKEKKEHDVRISSIPEAERGRKNGCRCKKIFYHYYFFFLLKFQHIRIGNTVYQQHLS